MPVRYARPACWMDVSNDNAIHFTFDRVRSAMVFSLPQCWVAHRDCEPEAGRVLHCSMAAAAQVLLKATINEREAYGPSAPCDISFKVRALLRNLLTFLFTYLLTVMGTNYFKSSLTTVVSYCFKKYTVSQKKRDTRLLSIASPNRPIDRFWWVSCHFCTDRWKSWPHSCCTIVFISFLSPARPENRHLRGRGHPYTLPTCTFELFKNSY